MTCFIINVRAKNAEYLDHDIFGSLNTADVRRNQQVILVNIHNTDSDTMCEI